MCVRKKNTDENNTPPPATSWVNTEKKAEHSGLKTLLFPFLITLLVIFLVNPIKWDSTGNSLTQSKDGIWAGYWEDWMGLLPGVRKRMAKGQRPHCFWEAGAQVSSMPLQTD